MKILCKKKRNKKTGDLQPKPISATGLLTMSEYGRRIGVSRQRVAAYIAALQISPSALHTVGKRVKINPAIADADLSNSLSENSQVRADLPKSPPPSNGSTGEDLSKADADRIKSIAQARHWEVKTKIMEGQYVERSWVEQQLAMRALVVKQDMENFFRSRASDEISICDGNQDRAAELIEYHLTALEIWIGRYSQPIEFGD